MTIKERLKPYTAVTKPTRYSEHQAQSYRGVPDDVETLADKLRSGTDDYLRSSSPAQAM
jgi:hypothetical protein